MIAGAAKLYAESMVFRAVAIAGAVGWVAVIALGFAIWVQAMRHDVAIARADAAESQINTATANATAASESAAKWKATADRLRVRYDAVLEAQRVGRERDRQAVAEAEAARREADATLNAWLDRYAAATADAECAAIERLPICEVPR